MQLVDIRVVYPHAPSVERPLLRVWGRSADGAAVVADFPYCQHFWAAGDVPDDVDMLNQLSTIRRCALKHCFCRACKPSNPYSRPWPCSKNWIGQQPVLATTQERRTSFVGYHSAPRAMTRIEVAGPWAVKLVEKALRRNYPQCSIFEAHVSAEQRWMVDNGVTGCGWLDVRSAAAAVPDAGVAPLVVYCLDIECLSLSGEFPTPLRDPVITVACVVTARGRAREQTVFQLDTCNSSDVPGADVYTCATEKALLNAVYDHMRKARPDIIAGYNSDHFDLPYLKNRALTLGVPAFRYNLKDRIGLFPWHSASTTRGSAQMGEREVTLHDIPGTVTFDVLDAIRDNHKLRSYTLNAVSEHFLGDAKDDVKYSEIAVLMKSEEGRGKLARYCLQDTVLVADLIEKLHLVTNAVELSKVTGTKLGDTLHRGQSLKVEANVLKTTTPHGMVMPTFHRPYGEDEVQVPFYNKVRGRIPTGQGKTGFQGATVLEPKRGFYDEPIAVLDFASLYPSIIQAYNLSHDTLVAGEAEAAAMGVAVHVTPDGTCFVKDEVRKGILPTILAGLLEARKHAKRQMKEATNDFDKAVFDGKQLALKICANSVYGKCWHTARTPPLSTCGETRLRLSAPPPNPGTSAPPRRTGGTAARGRTRA